MANTIQIKIDVDDKATPAFRKFATGVADSLRKSALADKTFVQKAEASLRSYEAKLLAPLKSMKRMVDGFNRTSRALEGTFDGARSSIQKLLDPMDKLNKSLLMVQTRLERVSKLRVDSILPRFDRKIEG